MKVLHENIEEITIEFDKDDFNHIVDFFLQFSEKEIYEASKSIAQFEAINKLVHLEGVGKKIT